MVVIVCCLLTAVTPCFAETPAEGIKTSAVSNTVECNETQDPFDLMRDIALSFFKPLEGSVINIEKDTILSDITSSLGIKEGMRLELLRKSEPFYHPITEELIGYAEERVGVAEVVAASPEGSMLKAIEGSANIGDILRLSSARVRALFYQMSDVDWNLSEEYYYRLKDTGRFQIIDTSPGRGTDAEITEEARILNTEVVIVLSSVQANGKTVLMQRLLWAKDSSELSSVKVTLEKDVVRKFRLGEEFFTPEKDQPTISFTIPYSTRLIATADMDGDGVEELAISTGNVIRFYSVGPSLRPALNAQEIRNKISENHLWMEVHDVDGDGADELLVTSKHNGTITSRLYKYKDRDFPQIWKKNVFARLIKGELYAQERLSEGGYAGPIFRVDQENEHAESNEKPEETYTLSLPEGINIYDFSFVTTPGGSRAILAYDSRSYLNLLDDKGAIIWRSNEDYGGPVKKIHKDTVMAEGEQWYVSNKIIVMDYRALTAKRIPVARSVKGLGFKKSSIMKLYWTENNLQEHVLIDDIPGTVIDYAVSGDRLFVLTSSLGLKPINILKGRGLYTTRLFIYPLEEE
jgi:hypothetical protein